MAGPHLHWLDHVPDLLGLARSFPADFPFLLDSSAHGPLGRHSLLLLASGPALVSHPDGQLKGPGDGDDFLARLQSWLDQEPGPAELQAMNGIPFAGGWFLYLGYEIAGEVERSLRLPAQHTGFPDAFAQRCPGAIIVFHSPAGPDTPNHGAERALVVAENEEALALLLQRIDAMPTRSADTPLPRLANLGAEPPQKFEEGVRRVLEYLAAGDVFQVNISRAWRGQFESAPDPVEIYRRLRAANPAPFAGLVRFGPRALLSSSPERLVQVRGKQIQTRPIAGTRPRGREESADQALSRELLSNLKERAEHIMLIDLERNDLGRVCVPGSVEVNELMVIESYAHVHHIVSNVRGTLRADASPVDAMAAVFPGGTITGCPKVRCMEIIAELEGEGRGFYTGSMGYLGRDGNLDLNILIRSMMLSGEEIGFRTGAGIVADSIPERELQETEDKARGMLLALQPERSEAIHA